MNNANEKNVSASRLEVITGEQRGDDIGSSLYPSLDNDDIKIFLLSEKTSPIGYIAKYLLTEEETKKMKEIRNNSALRETIKNAIKQYINMDYDEFAKLPYEAQQNIIDNARTEQKNEDFQQKNEGFTSDGGNTKIIKGFNLFKK